jgi:hypothetical protein
MRAWQVTVVCIGLLVGGLVEASQLETILKPPEVPAQAGQAAVITLFFTNSGLQPASVDLAAHASGRLAREEAHRAVALRYLQPPQTPLVIPPAGFRKIAAEVALPEGWSGMVSLTIDGLGGPPVVFRVQEATQSPTAETPEPPAAPPLPPRTRPWAIFGTTSRATNRSIFSTARTPRTSSSRLASNTMS